MHVLTEQAYRHSDRAGEVVIEGLALGKLVADMATLAKNPDFNSDDDHMAAVRRAVRARAA
jgi:hypothetical protein